MTLDNELYRTKIRSRFGARILSLSLTCSAVVSGAAVSLYAKPGYADLQTGASLENATVRDAEDRDTTIPSFGEKVLLILYTDPDVADQNDPFADKVKAAGLDLQFFQSVGIANMQDAPAKPNWIIRAIIRSKIKKYHVTILTDPKRLLVNAWNLGNCNDRSVVILIGKDKKVRYFHKGALSPQDHDIALNEIRKAIHDAGGP